MPPTQRHELAITDALDAIRLWEGHPNQWMVTRAELIVGAWRAGVRNIAELARAANVTRDTVYADLAACGIDHRDKTAPIQHLSPNHYVECEITSFGYKFTRPPSDATLTIDVRPLVPPADVAGSGLDATASAAMMSGLAGPLSVGLADLLNGMLRVADRTRSLVRFAVGSDTGQVRAVAIADAVATHLLLRGRGVDVVHLDVARD